MLPIARQPLARAAALVVAAARSLDRSEEARDALREALDHGDPGRALDRMGRVAARLGPACDRVRALVDAVSAADPGGGRGP